MGRSSWWHFGTCNVQISICYPRLRSMFLCSADIKKKKQIQNTNDRQILRNTYVVAAYGSSCVIKFVKCAAFDYCRQTNKTNGDEWSVLHRHFIVMIAWFQFRHCRYSRHANQIDQFRSLCATVANEDSLERGQHHSTDEQFSQFALFLCSVSMCVCGPIFQLLSTHRIFDNFEWKQILHNLVRLNTSSMWQHRANATDFLYTRIRHQTLYSIVCHCH